VHQNHISDAQRLVEEVPVASSSLEPIYVAVGMSAWRYGDLSLHSEDVEIDF